MSAYLHIMKGYLERTMQGGKQSMLALAGVAFAGLLSLFMVLRFFRLMLCRPQKEQRIADMGY